MYIKNYLNNKGEVSPEMLEVLIKDTKVAIKENLDNVKIQLELTLAATRQPTSAIIGILIHYETQAACAALGCELLKKELNKRYEESQKESV